MILNEIESSIFFITEDHSQSPLTSNYNTFIPEEDSTFCRLGEEDSALWKKIKKNNIFHRFFQGTIGLGTTTAFIAFVMPAELALGAVTTLGLVILGITSPALKNKKGKKVWRLVKNKLFGLISDLAVLPKVALFTPLAFNPNKRYPQNDGIEKLIVFVHGFLHNNSCWHSLSQEIYKETKQTDSPITEKDVYAINLGKPITTKSIDTYARSLATKLEKIRIERNIEQLNVILDSHSMGGLVSAVFATKYAIGIQVNVIRLIANGTPWHGTKMAKPLSGIDCAKEMIPGSSLQKELQKQIEEIGNRVFLIASKGDTVVPYSSALGTELPIPEKNRLSLNKPFGHLAMLESKECKNENKRLIKEAWIDSK